MLWHGKFECYGMEDQTVLAYGCRKTNKLICGMERKNVMAYGRLPLPAFDKRMQQII